jgi:hypothetical protein
MIIKQINKKLISLFNLCTEKENKEDLLKMLIKMNKNNKMSMKTFNLHFNKF